MEEKICLASLKCVTSSTKIMKTYFYETDFKEYYDVSSSSMTARCYWFSCKDGISFCVHCTETMRFYTFRRATCDIQLHAAYPGIWINILHLGKNI